MSQVSNAPLTRSQTIAIVQPNHWIIGAREDMVLFLLTPLVLITLVVVAQHFWSLAALGVFATVLAMGHYLPGLMRAYGDPALFNRFRLRFLLAPVFFIATAMYMANHERQAFLIVVVLWGSWHWLMQTYGLVRIYDAKAANFDSVSARLDYALCVLWFGIIYWETDGAASVLMRFYQTGAYLPPSVMIWACRFWVAVTLAVTTYYLLHAYRRFREGHPPSVLKLSLLGITSLFYIYAFGFTSSYLVAFTLFEGYHDIQYLAIVWVFNRNRADKDANAGAFTKFLFRRRAPLIVLYVLLCLGFGSYRYFVDQMTDQRIANVAFGLITGLALVHFYFDGFIWRIRESSTSSTLGVKNEQGVNKIRSLSRQQRHGLLWAALGLPIVGLGLYETYGGVSDEINERAYKSVLQIRPDSHKTHFMLSQEYAKQGDKVRALEHASRARELRPNYDVYDVQYVDLLMENRDELSPEQLTEIASCYANAALTRPDLPNIFDNWGIVLQKLGRLDESERVLRRAVDANPSSAEVRYHLAQVLAQQQDYDAAANACLEAIRLDSKHVESHSMAATLLMQLGKPDLALPHFEQAIALNPTGVGDKLNLALALSTISGPLRNIDYAKALADSIKDQLGTSNASQSASLIQVYAAAGQFDVAIEYAETAATLFENSGALDVATQLRSIADQIRVNLAADGS